ncbi:MAG: hypothetical protein WC797_02085 [Candidatus Paceibacterota bacterium]|jgi:hypothetical protein
MKSGSRFLAIIIILFVCLSFNIVVASDGVAGSQQSFWASLVESITSFFSESSICTAGEFLYNGKCIDAITADSVMCGDDTTSLLNDVANCGECSHSCSTNNACEAGSCISTNRLNVTLDSAADGEISIASYSIEPGAAQANALAPEMGFRIETQDDSGNTIDKQFFNNIETIFSDDFSGDVPSGEVETKKDWTQSFSFVYTNSVRQVSVYDDENKLLFTEDIFAPQQPEPQFSFEMDDPSDLSISLESGKSKEITVKVIPTFGDDIVGEVSVAGLDSFVGEKAVTVLPATSVVNVAGIETPFKFSISVPDTAAMGDHNVTLSATVGDTVKMQVVTVTVIPPQFSFEIKAGSIHDLSVVAGSSVLSSLTLSAKNRTTQTVTVNFSDEAPEGKASLTFLPARILVSSTLSVAGTPVNTTILAPNTSQGVHDVTITVKSGEITKTETFRVTVLPAPFYFSVGPQTPLSLVEGTAKNAAYKVKVDMLGVADRTIMVYTKVVSGGAQKSVTISPKEAQYVKNETINFDVTADVGSVGNHTITFEAVPSDGGTSQKISRSITVTPKPVKYSFDIDPESKVQRSFDLTKIVAPTASAAIPVQLTNRTNQAVNLYYEDSVTRNSLSLSLTPTTITKDTSARLAISAANAAVGRHVVTITADSVGVRKTLQIVVNVLACSNMASFGTPTLIPATLTEDSGPATLSVPVTVCNSSGIRLGFDAQDTAPAGKPPLAFTLIAPIPTGSGTLKFKVGIPKNSSGNHDVIISADSMTNMSNSFSVNVAPAVKAGPITIISTDPISTNPILSSSMIKVTMSFASSVVRVGGYVVFNTWFTDDKKPATKIFNVMNSFKGVSSATVAKNVPKSPGTYTFHVQALDSIGRPYSPNIEATTKITVISP